MWKILDTGSASAEENMQIDRGLLDNLDPGGRPLIHLYDWAFESATYGYFLKPEKLLDLNKAKEHRLSLARRPTGGGLVFHTCDLAFSVLMPAMHPSFSLRPLDNYRYINQKVKKAIELFLKEESASDLLPEEPHPLDPTCRNFCMAKPTKYDVMIGNRKVAGAAQRKTKQGYLHQGSIALTLPKQAYLTEVLLPGTRVAEAMQANTYSLIRPTRVQCDLKKARETLKGLLIQTLTE